ncbi:hypothetical protein Daura_43750 [Dactylosporangium aurantiacum]|uniref:DUF4276 family protein n=1 Tax=Dactylosporangium aurantiacum TaxID=35754 RepID=A0A9Q9IHB3_9ACTN|nr:hypothetical protein [Dactylosporangium aurantiacum]UWZ53389.1 hypothetical protein Daura_43750 [Dactylosporangium aurantiacum]
MYSVLFLGEGPSDRGIVTHIYRIAESCGKSVIVTAPDVGSLPSPDRSVHGKLGSIREIGGEYDLVVIHRDADRDGPEARLAEILGAATSLMPGSLCVPAIPVRMTEAWLILDEQQIRRVAGNPNGTMDLAIPSWKEAERIADPKGLLRELLLTASGLTGRKRKTLSARLSYQRSQMLETLDPDGPVSKLPSWNRFQSRLSDAFSTL